MRLLLLLFLLVALAGAVHAQTAFIAFQPGTNTSQAVTPTSTATSQATLAATPVIGGSAYRVSNPVTYAKTATGLLVVLSPASLTGPGPLSGHTEGLTMEIPNAFIDQLFF